MSEPIAVQVKAADPVRGNLIVYFLDGTSVLYDAKLLFASRYATGNVVLADLREDKAGAE